MPVTEAVDQRPSETAVFAALHRAIAHRVYQNEKHGPDNFAEKFLPGSYQFWVQFKFVQANTRKKLNEIFPGIHEYMIARTAWLDGIFLKALQSQVPQIAILGAGYDSRAYRFVRHNQGTSIFELDSPPTQERKLDCLKKAKIPIPEQVSLIPIDFNRQSVQETLEKAGFDIQKESLFIWEGVTYYLEARAVEAILKLISQVSHPNSNLAFDYAITLTEKNIDQYGSRKFIESMEKHHQNEKLLFSIEAGRAKDYLGEAGLEVLQHLDHTEIEQEFLMDEKGTLIGRIPAHFRFILAKPQGIDQ